MRSNFGMMKAPLAVDAAAANLESDSRDEASSKENEDIFESLNMPASALTGIFLWVQQKLKFMMKSDPESKEAAERQCYIIFTAMLLTMFGLSSKKLIIQIEAMHLSLTGVDDTDPQLYSLISSSPSTSYSMPLPPPPPSSPQARQLAEDLENMDMEFDFDTASWRICVPMILPALISLIQLETINSTVRIRLLLRLKGCVNNADNFDIFLSVPNWQAYIFNCLAAEQSRIDFLDAFREACHSSAADTAVKLEDVEKEFYESQNIIDVLLTIMSDIHIHSIQFGAPNASYYAISKPREVRDIQFHNLGTKELLELMKKDNRKVGCVG
jgi:hypothetical protein